MRLAIVTPLPPQHTGIADYSGDLIKSLDKRFEIDIFSNADITSFCGYRVFDIENIDHQVLRGYDLVVYQMGNNVHFHLYMVELIKLVPGVVHLHDMVLHHTFAWITFAQGDKDAYFNGIERWYGNAIRGLTEELVARGVMPWDSKVVTDIPLFEEVVQYANACIVHSDFVKNKIGDAFPNLDVYKVDQLYEMEFHTPKKFDKDYVSFGIFGGVDPQKNVDVVIQALAEINATNTELDFKLNIVGSVDSRCESIVDDIRKHQLETKVSLTGRVDEEQFLNALIETDVLIALRYPTMGETSAVVMRAMQLGKPCIVNDLGWYSELPDHVIKISTQNTLSQLKNKLHRLLDSKREIMLIQDKALSYRDTMDFKNTGLRYSEHLSRIYAKNRNYMLQKQVACKLTDIVSGRDDQLLCQSAMKLTDFSL